MHWLLLFYLICLCFYTWKCSGKIKDQAVEPNLLGKKDKQNEQPASHITYHMITAKPMMAMLSLSEDEKKDLESYKFVISKHLSNETIQLESDKEEE